jgi:hypothetical protein
MRVLVESIHGCPPCTENPMSADSVCQPPVAGTKRIFAAVTSMKEIDWTGKTAGGFLLPTCSRLSKQSSKSHVKAERAVKEDRYDAATD